MKTKEEKIKANQMIAEFMGAKKDIYQRWFYRTHINGVYCLGEDAKYFLYDNNWNWLMPVIEKIESLNMNTAIYHTQEKGHTCKIYDNEHEQYAFQIGKSKIEVCYLAVLEFINKINEL